MQPDDDVVDEHGHAYQSTLIDQVWDHEAGDYEPLTEVEQIHDDEACNRTAGPFGSEARPRRGRT